MPLVAKNLDTRFLKYSHYQKEPIKSRHNDEVKSKKLEVLNYEILNFLEFLKIWSVYFEAVKKSRKIYIIE